MEDNVACAHKVPLESEKTCDKFTVTQYQKNNISYHLMGFDDSN